jgi:hypothetical protein
MVVGADKSRFGQLIKRLEDAYDVGTDNYPHTIDDAKNYLDRTADIRSQSGKNGVKPGSTPKNVVLPSDQKMSNDEALDSQLPRSTHVTSAERRDTWHPNVVSEKRYLRRTGILP